MVDDTVINFISISFEAQHLLAIPEPYRSFAIASSVASNDTTVFQRMIIFSFAQEFQDEVVTRISNAHRLTLERNLSAKVVEYIKLFSDFSKQITRSKKLSSSLDLQPIDKLITRLKNAKEYDLAIFLRNKVTNHYVGEELSGLVAILDDDHPLQSHASLKGGNSFHVFAEELCYVGSLLKFERDNVDRESFTAWILEAVNELNKIHQIMLVEIISKFIPNANLVRHSAEVEDRFIARFELPAMSQQIPLFAKENFDVDEYRKEINIDTD